MDFNKPVVGDNYSSVLSELRDSITAVSQQFRTSLGITSSNKPVGIVIFDDTTKNWKIWNGSDANTQLATKYGIDISGTADNALAVQFSGVSSKPTSLSGYGITDGAAVNQTMHIGTTSVAINRTSAALNLTEVNVDGTAGSTQNLTAGGTGLVKAVSGVMSIGSAFLNMHTMSTGSGAYTLTSGTTYAIVICIGGGAGGGGAGSFVRKGGGAGAIGFGVVVPGSAFIWSVGNGGAGGASSGSGVGGNGGTTSFGIISAAGGLASTGTGLNDATSGESRLGRGGMLGGSGTASNGEDGGAGGGGSEGGVGGAGGKGYIIVLEFA